MNNCSFCNSKQIYILKNGYIKCGYCNKKYSIKKLQRDEEVIKVFCKNINALEASKMLNVNYLTIQNRYKKIRKLITIYLDDKNQNQKNDSSEFDEYVYIKNNNIYTAQNFLTFNYQNKIYNLMLPSLNKFRKFNNSKEELSKFLFLNKIAKLKSKNSLINEFWKFLEEFLKKFKGVENSNFIYYLKEAEFKFNYKSKVQEEILLKLYKTKL